MRLNILKRALSLAGHNKLDFIEGLQLKLWLGCLYNLS